MATILLSSIALCQAVLAAWSLWSFLRRRSLGAGFLTAVLAAMAYGTAVLAAGRWLGEGPLLAGLSRLRFQLDAALAPLLIVTVFEMAQRSGLEWARDRAAAWAVRGTAIMLSLIGLRTTVLQPQLTPVLFAEILQYRQAGYAGWRWPMMITWALAIAFGLILLRRKSSPWLILGAAIMFAGDVAPASLTGPIARPIAELAFALCLLLTERRLPGLRQKD